MKKPTLICFFGNECSHCDTMRPLIAKLTFDTGIILDERDVWKSQEDFRLMENYQDEIKKTDPECDGMPFFYNTETKAYLCGEVSYKTLKEWAVL